ncbi:MAG: hypothetical protein KDK91_12425 [Gammaproteobacteria bacterium]|nr:hypothetical protein [Gammaproteobacteria bacterium]
MIEQTKAIDASDGEHRYTFDETNANTQEVFQAIFERQLAKLTVNESGWSGKTVHSAAEAARVKVALILGLDWNSPRISALVPDLSSLKRTVLGDSRRLFEGAG